MISRLFRDTAFVSFFQFWRAILAQALGGAGILLAAGVLAAVFTWFAPTLSAVVTADGGFNLLAAGGIGLASVALFLLVSLPFLLASLVALIRVADDALAHRPVHLLRSFRLGLTLSPALALTLILGVGSSVLLFIAAPLVSIAGLLGLLVTPLLRVIRRRRPTLRLPSVSALVWCAIPFAASLRQLATAILAIPLVALEPLGPVTALRVSGYSVPGSRLLVLLSLLATATVTAGVTVGAALLGAVLAADSIALLQGLAQLVVLGLTPIVLAVVYRIAQDRYGRSGTRRVLPQPVLTSIRALVRRPVGAAEHGLARTSVITTLALVASVFVVGPALVAPQAADAAVSSITYTVTSGADDPSAGALATAKAACVADENGCTLRAALAQAGADAIANATTSILVNFAGNFTIAVDASAPLRFTTIATRSEGEGEQPSAPVGSGTISIDGAGHEVTLDGQDAGQVLVLFSRTWNFDVRNLEIEGGNADEGGGLSTGDRRTALIENVTFTGNHADTMGGALYAGGPTTVVNSTFFDNSVGAQVGGFGGGADIFGGGNVSVLNSTFSNSSGGSLYNWTSQGYTFTLANSIIANQSQASFACSAYGGYGFQGSRNIVTGGDTTCPDVISATSATGSQLVRTDSGHPRVLPLSASFTNPAFAAAGIGADAVTCPATDARGVVRPSAACDIGAYQFDPATKIAVTSSDNPAVFGDPVTFTATVSALHDPAVVNDGAVQFAVDGVAAGAPVAWNGGYVFFTRDLEAGAHDVTATYTPNAGALFSGSSTSPTLRQTISRSGTEVFVTADPASAPVGTDVTFSISGGGESGGVLTGTYSLFDVTGDPISALATGIVIGDNNRASVVIGTLAEGLHEIEARYSGDENNARGTSATITVGVLSPSTTTVETDVPTAPFGAPVELTATVSSSATETPTGEVVFRSGTIVVGTANLDASGSASVTVADIPVGSVDITARYGGDSLSATSSTADAAALTITKAATSTSLQVGDSAPGFGSPVTLTATVTTTASGSTADPAGTVEFLRGTTTLASVAVDGSAHGSATAEYTTVLDDLPLGSSTVTARFVPSSNFGASVSASTAVSVSAATTAVALTSDHANAPFGSELALTATVTVPGSLAVAGGTVVFSDGTLQLGSATLTADGTATMTTSSLGRGSHNLTATLVASAEFATSNGQLTQVIARATTAMSLTASRVASVYGQSLDLTVQVTSNGSPVTADVAITEGTTDSATVVTIVSVVNGVGTVSLPFISAGDHEFTATFDGNADVAGSTDSLDHEVTNAGTTTTVSVSSGTVVHGDSVTFSATVSNDSSGVTPRGSISFYAGPRLVGTAVLVDGTASVTATDIAVSSADPDGHYVTTTFQPESGFAANTGNYVRLIVKPGEARVSVIATPATTTTTASATATVVALTGSGVPQGSVRFVYGSSQSIVDLVDGSATLDGLRFVAGPVTIYAYYTSADPNFVVTGNNGFSFSQVYIDLGAPTVTLTDSAAGDFEYGDHDVLTAKLVAISPSGTPTGTIAFVARGSFTGDRVIGTLPVTQSFGAYLAEAVLDTTAIPAGTTSIIAVYSGDTLGFATATSAPLARAVSVATTTMTVTAEREPGWIGEPVQYDAQVLSSRFGVFPTGTVTFSVGSVVIGTAALFFGRTAVVSPFAATIGTETVTAVFTPADANFAAATADFVHTTSKLPTATTLRLSSTSTSIGQELVASVSVTPPSGFTSATPSPPSSSVLVQSDVDTVYCYAVTTWDATAGASIGSCPLTFTTAGDHSATAAYTGSGSYEASTSTRATAHIYQGAPLLSLVRTSERAFVGGETTRLTWEVRGPSADGAQITITDAAGTVICTAAVRVGSCDYTFPTTSNGDASFVLSYAGDGDFSAGTTTLTQKVTGCVPTTAPGVNDAAGGTVTVTTPNCMDATGYLVGSTVTYVAVPAAGYEVTNWLFGATGRASVAVITVTADHRLVANTVNFTVSCVTVRLVSPNDESTVYGTSLPNCGNRDWTYLSNTVRTGSFRPGTVLGIGATLAELDAQKRHIQFAGWQGLDGLGGDAAALTTSFTVPAGRDVSLSVRTQIACYTNVTIQVTGAGTSTIDPTNCTTAAGAAGYLDGSRVAVTVTGTDGAYLTNWGTFGLVDEKKTLTGATGTLVVGPAGAGVVAIFGSCVQVNVIAKGEGTVGIDNPGNCPTLGAGWYKTGTWVTLTQTPLTGRTFSGWTGLPVVGAAGFTTTTAQITQGGTFVGTFFYAFACKPITYVSVPAGAVTISSTIDAGTCPAGTYDTRQGGGSAGPIDISITATPVSDAAQGGTIGISVATTRVNASSISSAFSYPAVRGATQSVSIYGPTTVTATVCQGINATVTLVSPTGESHTMANPSDADFVNVSPTPTCPYGTGYTVPQTVNVFAMADPVGYRFQSWSGALSSTDLEPVQTIAFDGSSRFSTIDASYAVICYSLTSNWDAVAVVPAPNCPDAPEGSHSYIGGTAVSLQATGEGSNIFREWQGATDVNLGELASVTMTSDRTLYAYYSSKSTNEKIVDAFSDAGNAIAVAMKKTVGVLGSVASALIMGSNPAFALLGAVSGLLSGVSLILGALGVKGSAMDGFNSVVGVFSSIVTYMTSITSCATTWASAADGVVDTNSEEDDTTATVSGAIGGEITRQANTSVSTTLSTVKNSAGRVASAAAVGYAIYQQIDAGGGSWDSSAESAWTSGGDVYMRCMAKSIPSWVGLPPVPETGSF